MNIKELAEGTSGPVRAALLALEAKVMMLELDLAEAYERIPSQPTQSDALREALERIGVGMMPPEIIEGKLTLRLMRVDIAQE
jgi:hypothetical protein